jgi:hypothetical protein
MTGQLSRAVVAGVLFAVFSSVFFVFIPEKKDRSSGALWAKVGLLAFGSLTFGAIDGFGLEMHGHLRWILAAGIVGTLSFGTMLRVSRKAKGPRSDEGRI